MIIIKTRTWNLQNLGAEEIGSGYRYRISLPKRGFLKNIGGTAFS